MIPGATLGHYRIDRKLGAGGMGEVWLAQDSKLDRAVALKVLPAEFARDPERMRRFAQEARAASALNHPNVAHIYEIGESGGLHFIAMEYVEGDSLKTKTGGSMDSAEILDIGVQIADALDEAHSKGVTHRDIKPGNIMLTARGQVKVLDFGLAKLDAASAADAATIDATPTGILLGTPSYMSPEQALGRPVDHRSDLFSLGVVLYEMATGRVPFSGANAVETIHRITTAQPDAIARFHYDLPPEVERIIRKCLEKDRERRYQSAREVLVDLRNLKRDSDPGTTAAPVAPARRRYVLATLAVAVLALSGLALYLAAQRGKPIDSLAVLPFANASNNPDAEYLSDGITESISSSLSKLPKLRVVPRSMVFRYKGREVDAQKAGRELNVRAVLTGRVMERGGNLIIRAELTDVAAESQLWGEQYNRKVADIFAVQEEISKEISERLRLRLTGEEQKRLTKRYTENAEAYQLYLKGRYYWDKRTPQAFNRAMGQFEQALEKDSGYALAYGGLADCYNTLGWYGVLSPKESFPKARAAATRALGIDEALAEPHTSLGWIKAFYDWDWPGAEREYRRAMELNPNYSTAHMWYGGFLRGQGRLDEAMAEVRRAQEVDPLSLVINAAVGVTLHFRRQYDQAIEQYRKTVEMDPNFPLTRLWLGMAYEQKKMYEAAVAEFQKASELFEGEPIGLAGLGHAYAVSGRTAAARKVLEELNQLRQRRYVSAYFMALPYAGLGEKDQAWAWLEKAYEERASWLSDQFKVDPRFDSLRSDPRYQDLLRRMNLPP